MSRCDWPESTLKPEGIFGASGIVVMQKRLVQLFVSNVCAESSLLVFGVYVLGPIFSLIFSVVWLGSARDFSLINEVQGGNTS
jgi:hypothetical protein